MNQSIVVCGKKIDIGKPVVLWNSKGGWRCPNPRGRKSCSQHDPVLNDQPSQAFSEYRISDPARAYEQLQQSVHQLILHYDVCYCSYQCHQIMKDSSFKGSHFYLDLDGTLYQTVDLYWKTNTAPADDKLGNERSVHVEMANLSWEALARESSLYPVDRDQYRKTGEKWRLILPDKYKNKIRKPGFTPRPTRTWGDRGYFSRQINGKMVRMWDFTEDQYQTLIQLCFGLNRLLPNIQLEVPFDKKSRRTPLDKIKNHSTFKGVLGHAHVQGGVSSGVQTKFDPGSAFHWSRLRKAFAKEKAARLSKPRKNKS